MTHDAWLDTTKGASKILRKMMNIIELYNLECNLKKKPAVFLMISWETVKSSWLCQGIFILSWDLRHIKFSHQTLSVEFSWGRQNTALLRQDNENFQYTNHYIPDLLPVEDRQCGPALKIVQNLAVFGWVKSLSWVGGRSLLGYRDTRITDTDGFGLLLVLD